MSSPISATTRVSTRTGTEVRYVTFGTTDTNAAIALDHTTLTVSQHHTNENAGSAVRNRTAWSPKQRVGSLEKNGAKAGNRNNFEFSSTHPHLLRMALSLGQVGLLRSTQH